MVDAVSSVKEIIKLALMIKAAAETARRNEDDCVQLRTLVSTVQAVVAPLENMDAVATNPAMAGALTCLQGALHRGHNLVTHCQEQRNKFSTLFRADTLSRKLVRVTEDIKAQMMVVIFATTIQVNVTLHKHFPLTSAEDAGIVGNSPVSGESNNISYVEIHVVPASGDDLSRLRIFHLYELVAATNNFSEQNVTEKNFSTTVYKGVLDDRLMVSIKRYDDQSGQLIIQQYVHIFQLLRHENIVSFLGFCLDDGYAMLVEECMHNTTFSDIINGFPQRLDWSLTWLIIQGIAQGVAYMHSKHIIHSNLQPASIILYPNMKPKICHFERSIILDENVTETVSQELVGTMCYLSPEYITCGIASMKHDVFSFGVILLHGISGMRSRLLNQHPITWAWEVREIHGINGLLDSSWCNECQLKEIQVCMEVGLLCTQEFPEDRPTMLNVLEILNGNAMLPTPKKPSFIKTDIVS